MDLKAVISGAFGSGSGSSGRSSARTPPGAPASGQAGMLDFRKWDMDKALRDGYEINEWVHACVNILARHAASVPWRVSEFTDAQTKAYFEYEKKGIPASQLPHFFRQAHEVRRRFSGYKGAQPTYEKKMHLRALPEDPLEQLLEDPNEFNTRQDNMERLVQHLYLSGNAMLYKLRSKVAGIPGRKTPLELWPLYPQSVKIDADGQVPIKYVYQPNGADPKSVKEYEPKDVIHFQFVDPANPIWGISPLMAAARSVDTDVQAARFQLNSMSNRGVTDYMISFEKSDGKSMSRAEWEEARRQFQQSRNGPENARSPWLSGTPAKVQHMSLSSVELDYIRTRGLNRQAICSIFGVYPPVIAVMEGFASPSAIDAILRHHWTQTMIPLLEKLMAVVNKRLVSDFGANRMAWFDPSNVEALNDSLMERYRMQKIVHTQGVPMTELNRRFDLGLELEDVVGADMGFFPAGVVPAHIAIEGGASNEPGNPNTPPEGGDPGEPGDEQGPNEQPVQDIPNDPSVEDPAEAANREIAELEGYGWKYFNNGHGDPHEGQKRWTPEEIGVWAAKHLTPDNWTLEEGANYYTLWINEFVDHDDLPERITFDGKSIQFYHGEGIDKRRERLLEIVKSWE